MREARLPPRSSAAPRGSARASAAGSGRARDGPTLAETCESDGTLTGYHPGIGVIHNVSRDHAEVDSLRPQFEAFARSAAASS